MNNANLSARGDEPLASKDNQKVQQDCRTLTAASITNVAEVCNVSYSQVLNYVNHCRAQDELLESLQLFVFRFRPDLQL